MSTARTGKTLLSICVCVQLLKIIKFMSALVPKMDLAPSVLAKVCSGMQQYVTVCNGMSVCNGM
jgi:hypothetical protein